MQQQNRYRESSLDGPQGLPSGLRNPELSRERSTGELSGAIRDEYWLVDAVPVEYKGGVYQVLVKLFLPANYPDIPPMLRIINTERKQWSSSASKYIVIEDYKQYQSTIDPTSYTLRKLPTIVNWNKYLDLVRGLH